jgi:hypothetical protein
MSRERITPFLLNSHLAVGRDAAVRLLSINRATGGKPHRSIRQESSLIINNAEFSQKPPSGGA